MKAMTTAAAVRARLEVLPDVRSGRTEVCVAADDDGEVYVTLTNATDRVRHVVYELHAQFCNIGIALR